MKCIFLAGMICLLSTLAVSLLASSDPDLVVYYSFDKAVNVVSFSIYEDESGNGHSCRLYGVAPDPNGKRNGAAKFVAGNYLDTHGEGYQASEIPTEAMTVCAWVKPENTGDHLEIFNAQASDQTFLCHTELRSDGRIRWLLRSDGGNTIFDIQDGHWDPDQWIHYAGTYSAADNTAVLYTNGEKITEATGIGNAKIASNWGMGARLGCTVDKARFFAGLMDDFCIFKRAITQDEIKLIMASGPPIPSALSSKYTIATKWGAIKLIN